MRTFARYVTQTEGVLNQIITGKLQPWKRSTVSILNGQPWDELRRVTDLERLRQQGAFFTSGKLARLAIDLNGIPRRELVGFDPACGSGDLLLMIARHLRRSSSLPETLEWWGRRLVGIDRSSQFVRLTKIRLALLALYLGANPSVPKSFDLARYFPHIKCGDGLKADNDFRRANYIALNPPFFLTRASPDCTWATGRITAAAQFMEYAVMNSREGAELVGILPDVLRTGTSYGRWRALIEKYTARGKVRHWGLFDNNADVHVFVFSAIKANKKTRHRRISWWRESRAASTVADFFDVHVGAVVPHRHRRAGPIRPYIHARTAIPWKRMNSIAETRKFRGTTFSAPFVVIRRTSRPEDAPRAVASLVAIRGEVAVENHLIVCKPKCRTIAACKRLIRQLRQRSTDLFLNDRMRCRHLTVSSVREIPMSER